MLIKHSMIIGKNGYIGYRNGISRFISECKNAGRVVFLVSDHILRDEATTAEERQNSFTQMMEIALEIAE